MVYYRCKCGKSEAWSSMGTARCRLCSECKTTLECHPDAHIEVPEPHDWHETEETTTWRGEKHHKHFRKCLNCGEHEDLKSSVADS